MPTISCSFQSNIRAADPKDFQRTKNQMRFGFHHANRLWHSVNSERHQFAVGSLANREITRNSIPVLKAAYELNSRRILLITRQPAAALDFHCIGCATQIALKTEVINSHVLHTYSRLVMQRAADEGKPRTIAQQVPGTKKQPSGLGMLSSSHTTQPAFLISLSQQTLRLRQRFIQLARVFAAAAGVVGFAAAFAADDWGNRLDDFAGLEFRGEIW